MLEGMEGGAIEVAVAAISNRAINERAINRRAINDYMAQLHPMMNYGTSHAFHTNQTAFTRHALVEHTVDTHIIMQT